MAKKFLVEARVYDTSGFFPDFFGSPVEEIILADSEAEVWESLIEEKERTRNNVVINSVRQID